MAGKIHTDSEALYAVRNAIIRFADDFQNSRSDFSSCFQNLNNQTSNYMRNIEVKLDEISDEKRKIERQLEELEEQIQVVENQDNQTDEGRTDSFACDTCHTRMMLKVMGDATPCKSCEGCKGMMHRIYNNSERQKFQTVKEQIEEKKKELLQREQWIKEQISNLENEIQEIQSLDNEFCKQQDVIMALMSVDTGVDPDTVIQMKELSNFYKGIEAVEVSERRIERGDILPHEIGTVGPIYAEEYETLQNQGYALNDTLGKSGIEKAMEKDTGARALRSIIEEFMLDIMYEIPKDDNIGSVTITREYIMGTGGPVVDIRSNQNPPKKEENTEQ